MKIINSFSAGMLASYPASVSFSEIPLDYAGPRLPEGSTTLPEGAKIRWLVAEIRG